MQVILRPLNMNPWAGVIKYKNCYEDIAPYWTRSGRIYTGLTKLDEERLGDELGVDLNANSEFWKEFFIRTTGTDLYLNLEDARDELKYLFLKNHKRVKNSFSERKATANFVLINKEEEAKKSNLYNKVKRQAIREFDSLSPEDMRKCLRLYGHNADSMGNELVENKLQEIVEGNPQGFLDRWVNNELRESESLVARAISANIIRRNKNIYKYGTEVIGHSLSDTARFLDEPKNRDIKVTIIKQLEAKSTINIPITTELRTEPTDISGEKSVEEVKEALETVKDMDKARNKKRKKGDTI